MSFQHGSEAIAREEFVARREQVVSRARERGLDALLIWSRGASTSDYYGNVLYLTNHHSPMMLIPDTPFWTGRGHSALVLPIEGDPVLVVDIPDYPEEFVHVDDVRVTRHVPQTTAEILVTLGLDRSKVGLVGRDTMLASNLAVLKEAIGHDANFQPADDILEEVRLVKSPAELALMRRAAAVGIGWMSTMMQAIEPGLTEGEIVGEGLRFLASHGGFPYDVAVASGPNSHHYCRIGIPSWDSARKLERGDLIHIDAWGPVDGYYTDFVRSTTVGQKPSPQQQEVLEASIEVIEHVLMGVRPGVAIGALYERGSDWLSAHGFGGQDAPKEQSGTYFSEMFPGFGHCLGLGVESPWIIRGESTVLKPNMVLAVETLIGRPGVGGAGFEENVVITADGCESLTSSCPFRWWE